MKNQAKLSYSIGESPLGLLLVAAGERGVCAILIDDERAPLLHDLKRRFPRATLHECPASENPAFGEVMRIVEQPARAIEAPLEMHGTPFQQVVWQALLAIPAGTTTTYAEIARRIGAPKSSRAVGAAIAANPLAVVVPCHRVLRSDGHLSGYRWGVARKRALLALEAGADGNREAPADHDGDAPSRNSLAAAPDQV